MTIGGNLALSSQAMSLPEYQAAIRNNLDPVAIVPSQGERGIRADLESRAVGDLTVARLAASGSFTTCRVGVPIKPSDRYFLLQMQTKGTTAINHRGVRSVSSPGTILIMDSVNQVYGEQFDFSDVILMRLPEQEARRYIPGIELFCSVPFNRECLSQKLFTNLLAELWDTRYSLSKCDLDAAPKHVFHLLNAIIDSHSDVLSKRGLSHQTLRAYKVQQYVAENFRDASLNLDKISKELAMSRRTLCKISEISGTSISKMINNYRLDEVMKMLLSPGYDFLKVIDIALSMGFRDFSHFSRSFKRKYGCPPSYVRMTRPS